jgi:hypothetical protein
VREYAITLPNVCPNPRAPKPFRGERKTLSLMAYCAVCGRIIPAGREVLTLRDEGPPILWMVAHLKCGEQPKGSI